MICDIDMENIAWRSSSSVAPPLHVTDPALSSIQSSDLLVNINDLSVSAGSRS